MATKNKIKLILGSSSLFRKKLLEEAGFVFDVRTADIDEKQIRFRDFKKLVLALGVAKLEAILKKNKFKPDTVIVTSDLVVSHNGKLREKPISKKVDKKRQFGCGKGIFNNIKDDFDDELEVFKEYST